MNYTEIAKKEAGGKTAEQLAQNWANFQNRRQIANPLSEYQIAKIEEAKRKMAEPLKPANATFQTLDYEQTKRIFCEHLKAQKFKVSNGNKLVLQDLTAWLAGNSIAENGQIELDAKKGIFLCGGTGNGKTTLMKIMQKMTGQNPAYQFRHFKIKNMSELLFDMANGNPPAANQYAYNWCFDDLGVNYYEVSKIYGNTFHPLPYLIDMMYNHFKNGKTLLMTSNLVPKEIFYINPNDPQPQRRFKDGFDDRTRGRFNEMFNVCINTDIDYRFEKQHV